MLVKFRLSCCGYSVGGHNYNHEIEIDDEVFEGMTEQEKEDFIYSCIHEHILDGLDYGITEICED